MSAAGSRVPGDDHLGRPRSPHLGVRAGVVAFRGAKEQAVRDQFDMSPTRYYQVLNALIDSDAALDFDPAGQTAAAPSLVTATCPNGPTPRRRQLNGTRRRVRRRPDESGTRVSPAAGEVAP